MGIISEGKEAVKEVKEVIEKFKPSLVINRVPRKTLKEFKDWAKEDFEGDYGMALKWLMDFFKGILGKGHERAEALAMQALEEIAEMKQAPEEEKAITMVDGKKKVIQ